MSKTPYLYLLIFSFSLTLVNNSGEASDRQSKIDPILIEVSEKYISKLDFEISFAGWLQKFHPNLDPASANYESYLDAIVNYKILTKKADDFYKTKKQNLASEFELYFRNKAKSGEFLRQVEEQVIREAFIKSHFMVDANHILLAFNESDDEKSKAAIYKAASRLESLINHGEISFEQLVPDYSDDIHSKDNGGRISLFTVFEQIYPVESAAYDLETNLISKPIKSRFGYHLIRIREKIQLYGLKNASHILVKSSIDDEQAERKIFKIHSKITNKNFSELASQHSQDYKTASKGGELGTERLIYDLELKKQSLTPGSISKPFRSEVGWHIMTVSELIEFQSYWQQRSNLREMIQFDSRVQRVIDSLKTDNPYKPIQNLKQLHWEYFITMNYLRENHPDIKWSDSSELELIKTIADSKYSLDLFKLKEKYPVNIDTDVLRELFN